MIIYIFFRAWANLLRIEAEAIPVLKRGEPLPSLTSREVILRGLFVARQSKRIAAAKRLAKSLLSQLIQAKMNALMEVMELMNVSLICLSNFNVAPPKVFCHCAPKRPGEGTSMR